ncbi:MAG: YggS family pyridoxal phosphate-dependent enzyme [Gammaproteobacteria bacterium]|jgi:pyridoxal phosphate enzyme (YggS family)
MENIVENLNVVKQRIYAAEQKYSRPAGAVTLLAVSKTQPIAAITHIAGAGQLNFGENYPKEAFNKITQLKNIRLYWHFIGQIQSNKTKQLAQRFDWIQSVDREKIAQRLSDARPPELGPINVCIQVNISGESTKSGISPIHVYDFAKFILPLPGLRLRGLMVIPAPYTNFEQQRQVFREARQLYESLQNNSIKLDTLSMGMSNDLEAAIAEGSTLIRVGTAIFGNRES